MVRVFVARTQWKRWKRDHDLSQVGTVVQNPDIGSKNATCLLPPSLPPSLPWTAEKVGGLLPATGRARWQLGRARGRHAGRCYIVGDVSSGTAWHGRELPDLL